MRRARSTSRVAAVLLTLGSGSVAIGEDKAPRAVTGNASFMTHCAVCHGIDARGEGPLAAMLRVHPPDLTLLAKRNAGRYAEDNVRRIIDGRKPVKGHGGPEMPVWGDAFKKASDGYSDAAVREKILGIVEYLRSIQAPAR